MPQRKRPLPALMAGVPRRLQEAREAAGWNQSELGKKSGVGQSQISRLEKGERLAGSEAAVYIDLAAALGVRPGWLLTGELPRYANPVLAIEGGAVAAELVEIVRSELRRVAGGAEPTTTQLLLPGRSEKKARIRRARSPVVRPKGNGDKTR